MKFYDLLLLCMSSILLKNLYKRSMLVLKNISTNNVLLCFLYCFLGIAKTEERDSGKSKFGFPPSLASTYTVADCRSLVKTLVCGVKAITWRCASFKV